MSNKIIAKRYAIALFNTVQNDELDSRFADTQELLNTIHSSDDLMNVLKSPITKGEHKLNIISSLIKAAQSGKILKGDERKDFEIERIKIDLKISEFENS